MVASLLVALAGGCHASAGPVFGYAVGRGPILGWEAGGGHDPLLRANLGQSFRPGPPPEPPPPERFEDELAWSAAAELVVPPQDEAGVANGAAEGVAPPPVDAGLVAGAAEFVVPPPEEAGVVTGAAEFVVPPPDDEAEDEEDELEEDELEAVEEVVDVAPRRTGGTEFATYLAFEPGVVGGGTIGVAFPDWSAEPALIAGGWLGAPVPVELFPKRPGADTAGVLSFAIGYRYLAGVHELYLTPKLGIVEVPKI